MFHFNQASMNKIYQHKNCIIYFFSILTLLSCSKSDLEIKNPNNVQIDEFYQSETDALAGLGGVYDAYQYAELTASNYRQLEILTDNGQNNSLPEFLEIASSSHTSTNLVVENFWTYSYNVISRANRLIKSVQEMPASSISDQARNRIIAEAVFLRAYAYLDLTSLFGDIPFYLQPVGSDNTPLGKTPKQEIRSTIIAQLVEAVKNLPPTLGGSEKGRISSWAAKALLGKYYLYQKDWQNASREFKAIIDEKVYKLYPSYSKLFSPEGEYSTESVFEIGFIEGATDNGESFSTQVDTTLAPVIPTGGWRPAESLVNSYPAIDGKPISGADKSPLYVSSKPLENRDPRLRATVYTTLDFSPVDGRKYWNYSNSNKFAVRKYSWYSKTQYANSQGPQNYYMIRYADVLLMYAEAQNEAGTTPDESIYQVLKDIRQRAGILAGANGLYGLKPLMTKDEMRTAIRNERRWELALEHQRYFDLLRWEIAESVLNNITPNPKAKKFTAPRDYLWPIPQLELDNNPTIKAQGQNPGW
jgi:starch-binding outer membrane protein, SusD/RagB family